MKQPLALGACLIAFAVSAKAQPVLLPPPAHAYVVPVAALPPQEIVALMRSSGLRPLHRPVRQGRVYMVRAINPAGDEVGAVVDARSGRILRINPVLVPPNGLPVPSTAYGRPPGRMIAAPDGTGMSGLLAEPPPPPAPGSSTSISRAAAGGTAPAQAGAPPLPRPRPKVAATHAPAKPVIEAQPPTPAAPAVAAPASPPPVAAGQSKAGEKPAAGERVSEAKNPGNAGTVSASSAAGMPVEEQE